jgi:hypothetical protein
MFLFKLPDTGEFSLPLNQGKQCAFVPFSNNGIDFAVADPLAGIHDGWLLIDTDPSYLTAKIESLTG